MYWFAVASMPPATVIDDEYAAVSTLFDSWHAPISELIAATDPAAVFRLDINELAGHAAELPPREVRAAR